jgi:hypothetical protein
VRSGRTEKLILLGKALSVLPETERLKPVSDLLHRGSAPVCGLQVLAPTSLPDEGETQ